MDPREQPSEEVRARDLNIRKMAGAMSEASAGSKVDEAIGAACLFIVAQCDLIRDPQPQFNEYVAKKLRQVAEVLNPTKE